MLKNLAITIGVISFAVWRQIYHRPYTLKEPKDLLPKYDYVVVGAGSGGSALAARLSEDRNVTVLVLEAGGDHYNYFWSHIPSLGALLLQTDFDWQYQTVAQGEAKGNVLRWSMGKCIGGTGILDMNVFVRGNPGDYDQWAAMGNPGWSYKEVLPYLKKLETVEIPAVKYSGIN